MSGPAAEPAAVGRGHRLRAFGIWAECAWPLPGASAGDGPHAPPADTEIVLRDAAVFDAAWTQPGERIFQPAFSDGVTRFTIDRDERHYRLWLADYGRYLIAADGAWIACERDGAPRPVQERFVLAQALPVVAVLRGYEALHAAAVCGPAGGAAFVGPSGMGKTSIVGRLVLRGAGFLTDDVLALDTAGSEPQAHPGPPFMAIRPEDAWMVQDAGMGPAIGASDKLHVRRPVPDGPVPLRSIYQLTRGEALEIAPLADPDPQLILAQAFVPYIATPQRMLGHLRLAALIGEGVDWFRLQTPTGALDDTVLDAVEAHLRERGTR